VKEAAKKTTRETCNSFKNRRVTQACWSKDNIASAGRKRAKKKKRRGEEEKRTFVSF
jgi:hypothetical protein